MTVGMTSGRGSGRDQFGRAISVAIAHQVTVALLDNVTEVDADPELDAALGREASITLDHPVLHLDGAADRIDDASELNEDAISCSLNDAAMM